MSALTTRQFAAQQGDKLLRSLSTQIARTIRSLEERAQVTSPGPAERAVSPIFGAGSGGSRARGVNEVHDLRVAIRRFMRVLVVLKPCFPRGESRRIRRSLKRIMVHAGSVRDHDVSMGVLGKMAIPHPGPTEAGGTGPKGSGPATIAQQLRDRREGEAGILLACLQRWVERNLPSAWRKALKAGAENENGGSGTDDARFCNTRAETMATRILPEMAEEHFRCGADAAQENASVKEIHSFRIAARNLRYTLDLFAPMYGTALAGLLDQLKDVQSLLGDLNDCATVRRILHRLKTSKQKGGKEVLTALRKRQRRKNEQFRAHYAAEFANAATLRLWKTSLRDVGGRARTRKRPPARRTSAA
jgi:CHAD domain-containing protein